MRRVFSVLGLLSVVLTLNVCFATEGADCTHGIAIPCIQGYHAAIEQCCHKYVPAKDYATVRKHVPNMVAQAELIASYQLDSAHAAVGEEFNAKRILFLESVNNLKVAADGTDDAKLQDAFGKMHDAFVRLTSTLVLSPAELDDFHTLLASIFHDYLPNKNYAEIKKSIPALKDACAKLMAAKLSPAKQPIQKEYIAAVKDLGVSIDGIEQVIDSKSDEKIESAIEAMHGKFMAVAGLF